MAKFEVRVVRVDSVEEHPNADRLTVVRIGGYTCIANKHEDGSWRYEAGAPVVYIPEQSVLPEAVLRRLNMWDEEKQKGKLSGKTGDRVTAMRLRGIYSEGILLPVECGYADYFVTLPAFDGVYGPHEAKRIPVRMGENIADKLEITKYDPPIPENMTGEVFVLQGVPVDYDIEPIEKYPDVLWDDTPVYVTEKCHGICSGIAICNGLRHPDAFPTPDGARDIVVYSKGLGAKGIVFKESLKNDKNLYVQAMRKLIDGRFWVQFQQSALRQTAEVHFLGEIIGPGVQDLTYGLKEPEFRLFDIFVRYGGAHRGEFLPKHAMFHWANTLGIPTVPLLTHGFWATIRDDLAEFRDGKDSISGTHVREGVVICPDVEMTDMRLGRVILKATSPDYKLRKGNPTEYQ